MKNKDKSHLLIKTIAAAILLISNQAFSEVESSGVSLKTRSWPSDQNLLCIDKIMSPVIECEQNGGYHTNIAYFLAFTNSTPEVLCSINVSAKELISSNSGEVALKHFGMPTTAFVEIGGVHGDRTIQLKDLSSSSFDNPATDLAQFLSNINPDNSFISKSDSELALHLMTMMKSRLCSNVQISSQFTVEEKNSIPKKASACSPGAYDNSTDSEYTYKSCFNTLSKEITKQTVYAVKNGMVDYKHILQVHSSSKDNVISEKCTKLSFWSGRDDEEKKQMTERDCNVERANYLNKIELLGNTK